LGWHGRGMASVNKTRLHCVNRMGKTHFKPLAARHGRGLLCVNRPLSAIFVASPHTQTSHPSTNVETTDHKLIKSKYFGSIFVFISLILTPPQLNTFRIKYKKMSLVFSHLTSSHGRRNGIVSDEQLKRSVKEH